VTTIVGSAEASYNYGLLGGWSYALGADLGFAIFIPILLKLLKVLTR